jgi:uncharacterized protein YggE
MKRNCLFLKACVLGAAALALVFVCAACKAEGDITPAPTAQPEQPSVIVNNELVPSEHTIEVVGTGKVIAAPDFSTITIVVQGSSETSEEAALKCEERTARVSEIAAEQGVLPKNLTTAGVTLSTHQRESDGAITGYVATNTITITTTDVDKVNAVLSPIIDAGITESYEATYSLTDASAAYNEALAAAMGDAYTKASAIAAAGGVSVDSIVSTVEVPAESELVGVAFESSTIEVTAKVTVVYLIGAAHATQN